MKLIILCVVSVPARTEPMGRPLARSMTSPFNTCHSVDSKDPELPCGSDFDFYPRASVTNTA